MSQSDCIHFFFFKETATPKIYPLSLRDSLPIWREGAGRPHDEPQGQAPPLTVQDDPHERLEAGGRGARSEEHTSELQSRQYLVCRLLLEKKTQTFYMITPVRPLTCHDRLQSNND